MIRIQTLIFLFFSFSILGMGQTIKYDTIRVSPNDERNIYRNSPPQSSHGQRNVTSVTSPSSSVYRNVMGSGFDVDTRNLLYGANLGLYFSRDYSMFNLGPQVGYRLGNKYMMGVGVKYYYKKQRAFQYNKEFLFKNNLLGANVFAYYYPMKYLAVFVQPELNHLWSHFKDETTGQTENSNGFVPSLLVGGGVRLGKSHITLNYDLASHRNSPYKRGLFLGFSFFF